MCTARPTAARSYCGEPRSLAVIVAAKLWVRSQVLAAEIPLVLKEMDGWRGRVVIENELFEGMDRLRGGSA